MEELKERLTAEQWRVTQEKGTEKPFSSPLYENKREGIYKCVVCKVELFVSGNKYNSGTGWPSFYQPINDEVILEQDDPPDTEIVCKNCKAHLGHVVNDGPPPTGLRYCVNGESLEFQASEIKN